MNPHRSRVGLEAPVEDTREPEKECVLDDEKFVVTVFRTGTLN